MNESNVTYTSIELGAISTVTNMKTTPTMMTKLGNNQTLPSTQGQDELSTPLSAIVGTLSAVLVFTAFLVFWRVMRKQSVLETEVLPDKGEIALFEQVTQSSPTPIWTVDGFMQHGQLRCRLLEALINEDVGKVVDVAVHYEEFRDAHNLQHVTDHVICAAQTFLGPLIRDYRLLQMKLYKASTSNSREDMRDFLVTYSQVRRKHGLGSLTTSEGAVDDYTLPNNTVHLSEMSFNDTHSRLDLAARRSLTDVHKACFYKRLSQNLEYEQCVHNSSNASIFRSYSDAKLGNEVRSSWLRRFRPLRDLKEVKESLLLYEKLYNKCTKNKIALCGDENKSGELYPIPENNSQTKHKNIPGVDMCVSSTVHLENQETGWTGINESAAPSQDEEERERVCRELEKLQKDVEEAVKSGVDYRIRMATRQYRQLCRNANLCAPEVEFLAQPETTFDIEPLRITLTTATQEQDLKTLEEVTARICQKNLQALMGPSFIQAVKLQESLETVKCLTTAVLNLDRETMMTMRRYDHPPKVVHDVVMAILLVLGDPESETCDWTSCQKRCTTLRTRDSPGLMKRVCEFDIRKLSPDVARRALDIVQDFCEEEANVVNIGAAVLYSWVRVVCEHCLAWSEPTFESPVSSKKRTKRKRSRDHVIQEELKLKTALRESLEKKDVREIKSRLSKYIMYFEKRKFCVTRDNDLITRARQAMFELKENTFLEIMNEEIIDSLKKAIADKNPKLIKQELETYEMFCAAESGKITINHNLVADARLCVEEHDILNDLITTTESKECCSLKESLQRYETFCHQNSERIVADERLINEIKICIEQKEVVDSLKVSLDKKQSDLRERLEYYTAFCQRNAHNVVAEKNLIDKARLHLEQMDISDCLRQAIQERSYVKIELHLRTYEILCQENLSHLSLDEQLVCEARNTLKELEIMNALAQAVESKNVTKVQTLLENYESHCRACKTVRVGETPLINKAGAFLEENRLLDTLRESVEKGHYFEVIDYLSRYQEFCDRNKEDIDIDEDMIERSKACLAEAGVIETLKLAVYKKDHFAIQEEMAKYRLFCNAREDTFCANAELLNEAQAVLEQKELQEALVAEGDTLRENLKHAIEHEGSLAIKESLLRYKSFCMGNQHNVELDEEIVADAWAKIDGEELKEQVKAEENSLKHRLLKAVQTKAHVGVSQVLSRYECLCKKHNDILRPDKRLVRKAMKCLKEETGAFIKNQVADCENRLREGITDSDYIGVSDALEQYDLISKTYEGTITVDEALLATAKDLLQKQDKIKAIENMNVRLRDKLGKRKKGVQRLEGVRTALREYESALKEHPGLVSADDILLRRAYSFLEKFEPVELKIYLAKALKSSDESEVRRTFDRYEKFSEEHGSVDATIEDLAKQAKRLLDQFDREHLAEHQQKERILKDHLKQAIVSQHVQDILVALADYKTLSTKVPEVEDRCIIEEASATIEVLEKTKALEELQRDLDDTGRELEKAAASNDMLLVEPFLMRYKRLASTGGEDLKTDHQLIAKCEMIVNKLKPAVTHCNNNNNNSNTTKQDLTDALRKVNSSLIDEMITEAYHNYITIDEENAAAKSFGETPTCLKVARSLRRMVDALRFGNLKLLKDVLHHIKVGGEFREGLKDGVMVTSKCCTDLNKIKQLTKELQSLKVLGLFEEGEKTEITCNIVKAMYVVLGEKANGVGEEIPSDLLERVKTFDLKTIDTVIATKALACFGCFSVEQSSACNKPMETLYKWIDVTCNCCMVAEEFLSQHKR